MNSFFMTMSRFLFLFLLFSTHFLSLARGRCAFRNEKELHFINRLGNDNLFVHCVSKDDDLGNNLVTPNEDYNFKFCVNALQTRFMCLLQWDGKSKRFAAYKGKWFWGSYPCGKYCIWVANTTGIYLNGGEQGTYYWEGKA